MAFKETIKNEKGSAYIEFLISFFCLICVVAIGISILSIFSTKSSLDSCADTLMKIAETEGTTNIDLTVEELREATGLDFTVSWSNTEYMPGTYNVQLGDKIFVTLNEEHEIGLGKWAATVNVHSRREGMSEKYFK